MATLGLGVIGWAKQSGLSNASGGTVVPPTPAFFGLDPTDATALTMKFTNVDDGFNRSLFTQVLTELSGKVAPTIDVTPDAIGSLLTGAMGGGDAVTGTIAPYVHTIALARGDLNYYTFQRSFALLPAVYGGTAVYGENYLDCKVDEIVLSGKPNAVMTAKVTAMAGNARLAQGGTPAPTTPTYESVAPFTFWNGSLVMTVATASQSGTPTAAITAYDITFANKSAEIFGFGKVLPKWIIPGVRMVTGKLTIVPDSADQYLVPILGLSTGSDPKTALRTGSMNITLDSITITGGTSTSSLQLIMPMIGFTTATTKIDSKGKVAEMSIDFTAQIDAGNDEFSAIVNSSTATAY